MAGSLAQGLSVVPPPLESHLPSIEYQFQSQASREAIGAWTRSACPSPVPRSAVAFRGTGDGGSVSGHGPTVAALNRRPCTVAVRADSGISASGAPLRGPSLINAVSSNNDRMLCERK
jgi:hypothetical protein